MSLGWRKSTYFTADRAGAPVLRLVSRKVAGVGQAIVLAGAAIAPWWFGSVEWKGQSWLLRASLAAAVCLVASLVLYRSRDGVALPFAGFVVLTAWMLGFLQILPLERNLIGSVSPSAATLRRDLADEDNVSDAALVARLGLPRADENQPISLNPASTRLELVWLTLVAAFFVFGAMLFSNARAQVWLWCFVALNGAALAFFGLVQKLSFNGMLFWTVPLTQGGAPFGPFVNRNNAAGYLNLSLACALGMAVWALQRSGFLNIRPTQNDRLRRRANVVRRRAFLGAVDFIARLDAWSVMGLVIGAVIFAAVICTLSRGGMIAMAVAIIALIVVALASRRFSGRLVWTVLIALAGLGTVGWVNAGDAVRDRLATLLERTVLEQGRVTHWRDSLKAVPDFWRTGSGLGTYRYVYGLYQTRPARVWFYHAENQYIETLLEGGVVGLGLLTLFLGLVSAASWRLLRSGADELAPIAGMVGIFAVASQAVHAFFDFGMRIPSNSILFALICGSVCGRATQLASAAPADPRRTVPRSALTGRWLPAAIGVSLVIASAWGAGEAAAASRTEVALKRIPAVEVFSDVADELLCQAIGETADSISAFPDDAAAHATLAQLWVALYRSREFRLLERQTPSPARQKVLWERTSPRSLHERVCRLARVQMDESLQRLRQEGMVQETLAVASRHLLLARRANPLLPDVHLLIAQLSVLFAEPSADQIHVERTKRLASGKPELLYQCGLLDYQARRWDAALAAWRGTLSLSEDRVTDILRHVGAQLKAPETVERLLPPDPEFLIRLATNHFHTPDYAQERANVLAYAARAISSIEMREPQHHYLSGAVLALQGRMADAVVEYSRAVELDVNEIAWRYELASLLESQGRWDEARRHARLCVALAPDNPQYRELLYRISMAEAGRPPARQ